LAIDIEVGDVFISGAVNLITDIAVREACFLDAEAAPGD
jgi:hypothetical protein